MNRIGWLVLALTLALAAPRWASACPSCQEAAGSPTDIETEDDPLREARAFNSSILFMVAVPYALLAGGGVFFYVSYRSAARKAALAQLSGELNEAPSGAF